MKNSTLMLTLALLFATALGSGCPTPAVTQGSTCARINPNFAQLEYPEFEATYEPVEFDRNLNSAALKALNIEDLLEGSENVQQSIRKSSKDSNQLVAHNYEFVTHNIETNEVQKQNINICSIDGVNIIEFQNAEDRYSPRLIQFLNKEIMRVTVPVLETFDNGIATIPNSTIIIDITKLETIQNMIKKIQTPNSTVLHFDFKKMN